MDELDSGVYKKIMVRKHDVYILLSIKFKFKLGYRLLSQSVYLLNNLYFWLHNSIHVVIFIILR